MMWMKKKLPLRNLSLYQKSTTVMLFFVIVPVLSDAMTVAAPKVSMISNFLMKTFSAAILWAMIVS